VKASPRCEVLRSHYLAKEVTTRTLADFERLFVSRPAPGAYRCWCLANHESRPATERGEANDHDEKRFRMQSLVAANRAHGIIVYDRDIPVGWCQFGPRDELPRVENSANYAPPEGPARLWRITCFVVGAAHRRRGVATAALKAALLAIARKGGGVVEALPVVRWEAYQKYRGTVSMFRKAGFKVVAPFGKSNVVVRKVVRSAARGLAARPHQRRTTA